MSGNKGHRRGYHNRQRNDKPKPIFGDKSREVLEQINENSPVIIMFRGYAAELDAKHDRHERIVKLSRDITIESKRIIFLLHTVATDLEEKRDQIFKEADLRLNVLVLKIFRAIALELETEDSYQYLRAYTAGLQEYVEALTLYQFLKNDNIEPWEKTVNNFRFAICDAPKENEDLAAVYTAGREIKLLVPATDYFLGLADFTGELMRRCINNLSLGNIEDCFKTCNYVKNIYTGFLGVNSSGYKELGRKLYVLRQSLMKMEYVCYNIRVRGSEIPKHMLADVINTTEVHNDEDEGFY